MGYLWSGIKYTLLIGIIYLNGLTKADNNDQIVFQCPTGWDNINYTCYKAFNVPSPWDIADQYCKSMQSELVKIPDKWSNKDVEKLTSKIGLSEYWIGFTQLYVPEESEKAHWSNGEDTDMKSGFWANYNPNKTHGKCSFEVKTDNGPKWVLGHCDAKKTFVCEKTACTVGTFMCGNSRCIGKSQICDRKDDCKDGSDEQNCPNQCRFYQTGSSGTLTSDMYPQNYKNNSFCLWKIRSDLGTSIRLTFSDFLTEENTDFVDIFVGSLSESEAFHKYRLSGSNGTQKIYSSPNNLMVIKFTSDSSKEFKGFRAKWTTVSPILKPVELNADPKGNLTVDDYRNNEQNTWTIKTKKRRQIITLEKLEMNLLGKDEVIVFDGDSLSSPKLATYKSTDKPLTTPSFVQSTGQSLMILLKSRGYLSNGKFTFSYQEGCKNKIKDLSYGDIMSPGYDVGQNYPNSLDCEWYVEIPFNHSYTIQFTDYNIDTPSDIFYVYNIVNSKSILKYNSTKTGRAPRNMRIDAGDVQITLETNAVVNKKGFKAFFSIDCPDPNLNSNTIATPASKTWPYGTKLKVTCQPGYSFYSEEFATNGSTNVSFVSETSVVMICLKGGQWNVKTIPQCLPKYCGPVTPIKNGRVMNATGVQVGDVAQYTCSDGYTIVGKDTVQCQISGQWEAIPNCTATGCKSPPNITNGQMNIMEGTGTSVGSIVHYTCDPGYQIEGVPISQCMKSAKWSDKPPTCTILNCSAFGLDEKIPNSSIDPTGDVKFKESKNVTCDAGYTLNGTSTIVCLSDQSFSTLPTCEDINECFPPNKLNKCNQICINTLGSYYCECKQGYEMKADNVTCEDINECQTNNGGCEQNCKNTPGSYECSCKDGYALYTQNYTMNYPLPLGDSGKSIGAVYQLNHSCVPVLCPELGNLANGFSQPQRKFSHFGDTFYFSCKIGYALKGAAKTVCSQDGNWSSPLPTCEAIKCPPNGNDVHPDVPYLGFYNFTCDVKGKPKEERSRQCLYDYLTDTYRLLGDSYVCDKIDCGQPKTIPGMVEVNVTNTTYGSQYEIKCSDLYRLQGNSSHGNAIRCGSDAKWDYGDLKCTGVTCVYPSVPVEGTVEVSTFTEGSIATYNCTRKGYAPSGIAQRTCVKNKDKTGLVWDQKMPTCVDVQPPTIKNGTCGDSITLDKYSILNISIPEFADNSESFTVDIKPAEAVTGFVVTRNMTIVYTATDASGYNVSCTKEILVEDRPLEITCPSDMIVQLSSLTDTKTIAFNESMASVSGPGINHRVTFTPRELNISGNNIDKIEMIVAEASNGKKTVNCTFYVDVRASACSSASMPQVQYANWRSIGNTTAFTCGENYSYPDAVLKQEMKTECRSSWDIPFTSCSRLDKYISYYANVTFLYKSAGTISESCAGELQTALMEKIQKKAAGICEPLNHKPQPVPKESTFKHTIKGSEVFFHGWLENKVSQPVPTYTEKSCLKLFKQQLSNSAFKLYTDFKKLTSTCGNLDFDSIELDIFSECDKSFTKVDVGGYGYCVACPPGSYNDMSSGIANCTLCPIGEYQDKEGQTSCQKCPEGTSTYFPGGYGVSMCKAKCPAGFYSATGVPPCKSCPKNTYSKNSTYCESCPANTKGREHAASSIESCKAKCSPGSYSYDGYEPCHLCPQGFYSNQEMQTKCMECDDKTTTSKAGADNKNKCIDVAKVFCSPNPCKNGQCLPLGHLFTCNCSSGYTGDLCDKAVDRCSPNPCYYGGTCKNDGQDYKCNCIPGTNGRNCETIVENCKNETCKNQGICRNKINATQCFCLKGYGGDFCENVEYACTKKPCKNGKCRNLGTDNYKCDCFPGFKGENCEIQIDNCASSPCLFNNTCTNLVNDFSCNCTLGYSGKTCNKRPELCKNPNCTMGTCIPNISRNSYTCSCDVGYTYNEFCQFSMKTGNGSINNFYSKSENISSEGCISKCLNDAQCKAVSYVDTNQTCFFYKMETDACCKVFTKECTKPTDNFWTPWYSIKDSVEPSAVQHMLKNIGINVCEGKLTSVTQCRSDKQKDDNMRPDKYAMSLNLTTPCVVDNLNCQNGDKSECSMYRIRFQCAVSRVMQNNQCEPKTACHDVHCENGATCSPLNGSCMCPAIYNPPFCRTKRDFCLGKDCGNGTCTSGLDKATCNCHKGFEGTSCSENIDDCKNKPCDASGTKALGCHDLINDYHCPCKDGYKGKNCSEIIDNCLSNPCLHQGICKNQVNDFTCACPAGWTGKRCEKLYDHCKTDRCTNNAVCFNLFKTYYCRCEPNTFGSNCSESVNICTDVNPCLNDANCTEFGGKAHCKCKEGFTGIGCQIVVDFCKSEMCANGGTCITQKNSYKCECPPGFKGTNCEQTTNDCTTSIQTCEEPAPLKCPLGKTGDKCTKEISNDYDLEFYLSEKNGIATMTSPVVVSGTNLSLSLWVRFKEKGGQGTFLNLFMIKSRGAIEEKVPVLRIDNIGVTFTTRNGSEETLKIKTNGQMNDGRWNLITMAISDSGESADFRLNTFAIFEKSSAPIINLFGKKCMVILGCYYDAKRNMPVANKGFYGELSQVNIYSKSLDSKTDIIKLAQNPKVDVGSILVGWGNYKLERGVRKIDPSTANGSSPAVGQEFIDVKYCPKMVSNYGSQGRTLLRWKSPQFTDYSEMKQNYRPGTTVLWGRYAVTYEAKDKNGNVALCNFMVYAKESNCTKPDEPYEGTADCNSQEFPYYSCNITCNPGRALTAPAPLLFTCGPAGCWHPEKRHMPMRLPPCGQIKQTEITVDLNLEYNIQTTTCDAAKNAMEPKLRETMKNLNAKNGFILCKVQDCSDIQWNITCNDRLNAAVQDVKVNAKINRQNGSIIDLLTEAALDNRDFDYPTYGVGTLLNNQFSLSTTQKCKEGEALIEGRCVECTPGYYLKVSTKCDPCPVGTYQSKVAQTNCTKCPSNHTTLGDGHMNITYCKVKCPVGEFFDTASDRCQKCDILSYQDLEGQFFCKPCLSGKSTKEEGATSEKQCTETCPAGYEFTTSCTKCQIGFYRENGTANTCKKCSNNKITQSTGATSEKDCNITACFAGFYLNETSNNCTKCQDDQYQDEIYQKSCKQCPSVRYRTGIRGAKKVEDCKFFCDSGFEVKNKSCHSCPKGTYKDNNEDFRGLCKLCPDSKTTIAVNSSSVLDCNIHKCPVGQQPNKNQSGCDPCPLGTYQPKADQIKCIECEEKYSTRTDGSINPNSCEGKTCCLFCDSGYERVAGNTSLCKECEIGYFKDNSLGKFSKCQVCPNGNITDKVASTSEQNCTKANCSAGQYLDPAKNKCFDCDYGEYQDEKWKTFCKKCQANYTTYKRGANKNTSCLLSCDSGFELVNNKCQLCSIGYYRNNSNNPGQMSCLPCPDSKFVTEKEGSVSDKQCTVANCTAGFYLTPNNTCMGCPLNEYQNVSFQTKCLPCASGFKTWKTNSSSCVRICPAGEMNKNGVCTKCPIGFYRKIDTETCTKCPNEFLTEEEGAKNESSCVIPPCKAGEYYSSNACVKCPIDTFQDQPNQRKCKNCKPGRYTESLGTTKESECLSFCATNKHNCSKNATCIDDPKGFRCECNKNYIEKGTKCIHLCDTNYCENGATCSRSATVACACTKYYDGPKCERQLSAKEVSKNSTHSIIGAVVGVLAGILIIILIVTYVCVRIRNPPVASTPPDNVSFGGTLSTKFAPTYVPVNSMATQPILDPETQVNAFTNAAYDEDSDPAIFTKD